MRHVQTKVRALKRPVALAAALATVALALVAGPARADSQSPAPPSSEATGWYLALGDSVATGFQPGVGDDLRGGYVGQVLQYLQSQTPKTQLRNLACDHETSTTFTSGGLCTYEQGSQLAQGMTFLRAHATTTRLVTLTVGGNDVIPCLAASDPGSCANQALPALKTRLSRTLSSIHATAPGARIVVTNYYNPFLAVWFTNPDLAALSTTLQLSLNKTIHDAVTGPGDPLVADVASAFKSTDTTPINGVPTNVVKICDLTWMCSQNDDHPNDNGHALIACEVIAKLNKPACDPAG